MLKECLNLIRCLKVERFWFATLPFSFFGGAAAAWQHGKTIKDSLRLGDTSTL